MLIFKLFNESLIIIFLNQFIYVLVKQTEQPVKEACKEEN